MIALFGVDKHYSPLYFLQILTERWPSILIGMILKAQDKLRDQFFGFLRFSSLGRAQFSALPRLAPPEVEQNRGRQYEQEEIN